MLISILFSLFFFLSSDYTDRVGGGKGGELEEGEGEDGSGG